MILAVCLGIAVTAKRFWVGLFLGRQTYDRYADDLAKVMKKTILVGQVASLARDMEYFGYELDDFDVHHDDVYDRAMKHDEAASTRTGLDSVGQRSMGAMTKNLNESMRAKVNEMLGAWEEPKAARINNVRLPFRQWSDISMSYNLLTCRMMRLVSAQSYSFAALYKV